MSPHHERGPVVVGVDGSEQALHAVRWAAREAESLETSLQLTSALGYAADVRGSRRMGNSFYDIVVENTRHDLAAASAAARTAAPSIEIGRKLCDGHPARVLARMSAGAALVVVGHRGLSGLPGLFAGSVAARLAATAHCPVVVIREPAVPEGAPTHRSIVVGVDGSELSDAAVRFGFETADRRGVPLVAVHSWLVAPDSARTPPVDWESVRISGEALMARCVGGWSEKYPEVVVHRVLLRDHPVHALLTQSAQAQLLVVGSRGRGAVAGTLLGSVSQAVLHQASCPVAVARPGTEHDAT
ncbi:MAG: UspA protein [Pseudonocardia sp.]|nr:UspA protein [Pseudonocardia sp.]